HPTKLPSPLDGTDVCRLFDGADHTSVTSWVPADGTFEVFREVSADAAGLHPGRKLDQGMGKTLAALLRLLQEMVGQAQRGLPADARKPGQLVGQIVDGGHAMWVV
ncbi:MAG: hypothetical protein K0S78_6123, partial [Thermomicrobiales bacterium]|nr:hypothetical protein [Thermomicrobiales bacterium]